MLSLEITKYNMYLVFPGLIIFVLYFVNQDLQIFYPSEILPAFNFHRKFSQLIFNAIFRILYSFYFIFKISNLLGTTYRNEDDKWCKRLLEWCPRNNNCSRPDRWESLLIEASTIKVIMEGTQEKTIIERFFCTYFSANLTDKLYFW